MELEFKLSQSKYRTLLIILQNQWTIFKSKEALSLYKNLKDQENINSTDKDILLLAGEYPSQKKLGV